VLQTLITDSKKAAKHLACKEQTTHKKKVLKSLKARIGCVLFPVRKLIIDLKNYTKMSVGIKAGIYFASVLDYLVKNVFYKAINGPPFNDCTDDKLMIRSRHLRIVLNSDTYLNELTKYSILPIYSPQRNYDYK